MQNTPTDEISQISNNYITYHNPYKYPHIHTSVVTDRGYKSTTKMKVGILKCWYQKIRRVIQSKFSTIQLWLSSSASCKKYSNGDISCTSNVLGLPQSLQLIGFVSPATNKIGLPPYEYQHKGVIRKFNKIDHNWKCKIQKKGWSTLFVQL